MVEADGLSGQRSESIVRFAGVSVGCSFYRWSPFAEKYIVQKLMACSGGLTSKVTKLLAPATELAISTETESISMDLLEEAVAGTFKLAAKTQAESAQS